MSEAVTSVQQGVEQLMLRQVAKQMVAAALPESAGPAGGAYQDLFATVLADAVAEGQEAQRS